MLNHIGISVNNVSEIKNFYQDILEMKIVKQFTINRELSNKIFNINEDTDVYLMQKDELVFELFIEHNSKAKNYFHICLNVHSRDKLIEKAKKQNYTCTIIVKKNYNLVFIQDKTGNLFEIKEL